MHESAAAGYLVDEGTDDSEGVIQYDVASRLWLLAHPPANLPEPERRLLIALASTGTIKERARVAALYYNFDPPPLGFRYEPDSDARDLAGSEFYREVIEGARGLVRIGWSPFRYPEQEYIKRKAERESGWKRSDKGDEPSAGERHYEKLRNKFKRRFRLHDLKFRASRRPSSGTPKAAM